MLPWFHLWVNSQARWIASGSPSATNEQWGGILYISQEKKLTVVIHIWDCISHLENRVRESEDSNFLLAQGDKRWILTELAVAISTRQQMRAIYRQRPGRLYHCRGFLIHANQLCYTCGCWAYLKGKVTCHKQLLLVSLFFFTSKFLYIYLADITSRSLCLSSGQVYNCYMMMGNYRLEVHRWK